jgi:chromosomal replication initiation ATPase DnaA
MGQGKSPLLEMIEQLAGVDLRQLTIELAQSFPRQAMQGISRSHSRNAITPAFVAGLVADAYHTDAKSVLGPGRGSTESKARQALMSILSRSDLIGMTLQDIGTALGGRDHTTVLYGIDKVAEEETWREKGYQDVLAVLCEMLEVNYEEIKDVSPPRRARYVRKPSH